MHSHELNESNAAVEWQNFKQTPIPKDENEGWVKNGTAMVLFNQDSLYSGHINEVVANRSMIWRLRNANLNLSSNVNSGEEERMLYDSNVTFLDSVLGKFDLLEISHTKTKLVQSTQVMGDTGSVFDEEQFLNVLGKSQGLSGPQAPKELDDQDDLWENGLTAALDKHNSDFSNYGYDWAMHTYVPSPEDLEEALLSKLKSGNIFTNSSVERQVTRNKMITFRQDVKSQADNYDVIKASVEKLATSYDKWRKIKYTDSKEHDPNDPLKWNRAILKHQIREALGSSINVQKAAIYTLEDLTSGDENSKKQNKFQIDHAMSVYEEQVVDVGGKIPEKKKNNYVLKDLQDAVTAANTAYEGKEAIEKLVSDVTDIKNEAQRSNVQQRKEEFDESMSLLQAEVSKKSDVAGSINEVAEEVGNINVSDGVIEDFLAVSDKISAITDVSVIAEQMMTIADILGFTDITQAASSYKVYKRASAKLKVLSKKAKAGGKIDELTGYTIYGISKLETLHRRSLVLIGSKIAKIAGRLMTLVSGGTLAIFSESVRLVGSIIEGIEKLYLRLKGLIKKITGTRGQRRTLSAEVLFIKIVKEEVGAESAKLMYDMLVADKVIKKPKLTKPQEFASKLVPDSKEKKQAIKHLKEYNRGPLGWLIKDEKRLSELIKYVEIDSGTRPEIIQEIIKQGYIEASTFDKKESEFRKLLKVYIKSVLKELLSSSPLAKATALQDAAADAVNAFLRKLVSQAKKEAFELLLAGESALFELF